MKKSLSALLLCSSLTLVGCSNTNNQAVDTSAEAEAVRPTAVTVQTVQRDSIINTTSYTGRTSVATETSVTAQYSGTVEKVFVSTGDTVKKGDILLTIDGSDLEKNIEQAKVSLDSAQLAYDNTTGGSTQNQINQLENAIVQAQLAYDEALRNYNLYSELYEADTITADQLKQIEVSYKQAEQQLSAAKQSLEVTQNKVIPDSQALAQMQVEQAQVAYNTAVSNREKLTITAPANGTITTANFKAGELIAQSAPAFVISNLNTIDVTIQVTESDLAKFKQGQEVSVTISNKNLTGTVREIPQIVTNQSTLYTIKISIDNSTYNFATGMAAEVTLTTQKSEGTLTVPKKALLEDEDGSHYVYICDSNNITVKTPVTIGISNVKSIEVTSGISEGDTLVVGGLSLISEGDSLYPVEKED